MMWVTYIRIVLAIHKIVGFNLNYAFAPVTAWRRGERLSR